MQYVIYTDTNPANTIKVRDGVRDAAYVIDIELTVLGFDGAESLDEGVTGDWIKKQEIKAT